MRKDIHTYMHMHKNTFKTFWVLVVVALRHVNYFDLRQKSSPVLGHNCAACRHKTGKPLHYESVVGNFFVYPKTCSIHVLQLSWPENTSKKMQHFLSKKCYFKANQSLQHSLRSASWITPGFASQKTTVGMPPTWKVGLRKKMGYRRSGMGRKLQYWWEIPPIQWVREKVGVQKKCW